MTVTVYNLVSAVIWCNLFIFAFCFFIERNSLISSCGIKVLSLLFALAVLRVLIPVEFSFTRVLRSENLFPFIRDMLGGSCFILPISRGKLLAIIWALGSAILLAKDYRAYQAKPRRQALARNAQPCRRKRFCISEQRQKSTADCFRKRFNAVRRGVLCAYRSCARSAFDGE